MSVVDKNKIAFFDIDGTVFRSSLLISLINQLVTEEVFPAEVKDFYHASYLAWQNREGTYEAYLDDVVAGFLHHIKGVHYGAFADVGARVVAREQKKVYRYTRDLIQDLRDEGYYLVAISQSPKTILDNFCTAYGFDKVYGRIYEIGPQDRFTGIVADEHIIANKAMVVKRVIDNHPVPVVHTLAIGDTEGDITLLEAVDKPICFNPNQALYTHAKRCQWQVMVERKDVIYTIAE